jgi:hypothetical protein
MRLEASTAEPGLRVGKGSLMTPKETAVVPASIVAELRTGLYAQIGMAGEHPLRYAAVKGARAR